VSSLEYVATPWLGVATQKLRDHALRVLFCAGDGDMFELLTEAIVIDGLQCQTVNLVYTFVNLALNFYLK
jgi:hypothetical protein